MQNSFLSLVTFFVLSFAFGSAFDSCAAQEAAVKVVGIRVVGESYGKTKYGAELRPFNWDSGTTVVLLLNQPAGGLIAIDEKKSVVSKWTDDKNRNVMTKKSSFSGKAAELRGANISKDGKAAMLEISMPSLMQQDASAMKIEGELYVSMGSKTKTEKSPATSMDKGAKFELAGLKFKVESAGKPKWGKNPFAIKLNYSGTNESLKEIKFFSADGKSLEVNELGSMSTSFGGKVNMTKEFGFAKKIDKVIVGVESWTDRSVKKIPLELDVSLGL